MLLFLIRSRMSSSNLTLVVVLSAIMVTFHGARQNEIGSVRISGNVASATGLTLPAHGSSTS